MLVRPPILLFLCFCCLSNTRTGHLGPSRIDPASDPATKLRFDVLHQVVVPAIMGLMLAAWLGRILLGDRRPGRRTPT